ncbi:radical SAM protein [Clostridiaceae bacterium 35-E11]
MSKKHYIIPIFVPHKGCPFDCIFCNQKKITGLTKEITCQDVEMQIKEYLNTIPNLHENHVEIAFFGGSFTGIEINKQKELLSIAATWKNKGIVKDIRISTRPDYIDPTIMKFLEGYGVSIIELGVQSMDIDVLMESGRGHTPDDVKNAVALIRQFDIKLGLQMMIGLPKDNIEKINKSTEAIIALCPDFVRIYPTLVVRDTYLEKMYLEKQYRPLSLEEAISISKNVFLKFLKHKIPVIRIGLQPTENILLGREIITGPFHPAFRQLVESQIYKEMLQYLFIKYNIYNKKYIKLQGNPHNISNLAGHKKTNIHFLRNTYKIEEIKIFKNNDLEDGEIKILIPDGNEILYDMKEYAHNAI